MAAPFARTEEKKTSSTVPLLLHAYPLQRERVYRAVAEKRFWYIGPSRGPWIVTALHTTIHIDIMAVPAS
jgi:hypothetical protein